VILVFKLEAQNKYCGEWNDYFGNSFDIKPDSSFKYLWIFDSSSRWAKGTWKMNNDTIYFIFIPVYDTIIDGKNIILKLSEDEKSSVYTFKDLIQLSSGVQDIALMPKKLFYRHNKLFVINADGKLSRKKLKGWKGKWHSWYIRRNKYYK
jgi:hypothetical protein